MTRLITLFPTVFAVALAGISCSERKVGRISSGAAGPLPGESPSAFVVRLIALQPEEDILRTALQAAADHYGPRSFDDGVAFLDALPAGDASLGAFNTITFHLGEIDHAGAIDLLVGRYDSLPPERIRSALKNVALTWAEGDPAAAFLHFVSRDDFREPVEQAQYLAAILGKLIPSDPAVAQELTSQLTDQELTDRLISWNAEEIVRYYPAGARSWFGKIGDEGLRQKAMALID